MEVTAATTTSCLKRRSLNVLSNVTYSPSHRQAGARMINIPSILRTAPDLRTNISLAVLFGSNGNSYTVSTQSDCTHTHTHTHTHILHDIETLVGQKKHKNNWDSGECRVPF